MRRPLLTEAVGGRRVVVLRVDLCRVERLQGPGAGYDADLRGALIGIRTRIFSETRMLIAFDSLFVRPCE